MVKVMVVIAGNRLDFGNSLFPVWVESELDQETLYESAKHVEAARRYAELNGIDGPYVILDEWDLPDTLWEDNTVFDWSNQVDTINMDGQIIHKAKNSVTL
jgi:hypothetical protein